MSRDTRYYKRGKVLGAKFRRLLHLFTLDLSASQIAQLSHLNRNTVNRYLTFFRKQIAVECQQQCPLIKGVVEVDESYFGAKRARQTRPWGSKQINRFWHISTARKGLYGDCGKIAPKPRYKGLYEVMYRHPASSTAMVGAAITAWWIGVIKNIFGCNMEKENSPAGNGISMALKAFGVIVKSDYLGCVVIRREHSFLHLKECEYRFNHRHYDLYKSLLRVCKNNKVN